ncbi:hypothetical protein [Streptococcus uberis]|uniref:hypothetical protein n=1 Tax=Streptococcus uberis TaxID=1349 RepID=UPI001FF30D4D|nr:hypothetical protein [Streptococcus uberis]MCK1187804.1 hypothetical protein [Streptococcus uberis]MCK1200575.1 hypothetical protein [Streptococcus uberis]
MEMRELRGDDIFVMLSILGKLDVQDDVMKLIDRQFETGKVINLSDHKSKKLTKAEQEEQDLLLQKRGYKMASDVAFAVIKNIGKAKDDINDFLADLTGQDVSELSLIEYSKLIADFFRKEELKDFFKSMSSLFA